MKRLQMCTHEGLDSSTHSATGVCTETGREGNLTRKVSCMNEVVALQDFTDETRTLVGRCARRGITHVRLSTARRAQGERVGSTHVSKRQVHLRVFQRKIHTKRGATRKECAFRAPYLPCSNGFFSLGLFQ